MAGMRIPQQTENFDTLRELLDVIKDPSLFSKASELARKEMALTDAEKVKVDEARDLIKKYDKIKAELKAERDKLDADISAHTLHVENKINELQDRAASLNIFQKVLDEKNLKQEAKDVAHEAERKALDLKDAAIAKAHKALESAQKSLAARESAVKDAEARALSLTVDLARQKKNLEDKSAKLKALVLGQEA